MEFGKYGAGNTKFEKLFVEKLPMSLYDSYIYGKSGCGSTAISLLTGENPLKISKKVKNGHFSDSFMRGQLRKNGISSFKMTKANLTNSNDSSSVRYKIKDNHVILASQMLVKKEASWLIYWNGMMIHNFEVRSANLFDLINFPILTAYILFKEEWASKKDPAK